MLFDRFRQHVESSGLVTPADRVLVGYSGGADSTCLLHLLSRLGMDMVAGHLHHGQRPEADTEQRLCEAFADSLGVPFAVGRADVPRMSRDLKMGVEEAGREARYSFFRQAAFRLECSVIATAHTRNDQVESILLNATRGSGLSGLAGIPERRDNIVRLLLPFSREETRSYCEAEGLWYHDDPANADLSFSRARIRHRVLPELRTINPRADEAIARLGQIAVEEDRFLNGMAAAALEQSELPLNGDLRFLTLDCEVAFERSILTALPEVLFRRALRLAAEALGAGLSSDQIQLVGRAPTGSVTTEGGAVVCEWDERQIGLRRLQPTEPFRYPLTIPGETISDEFGWQFVAWQEQAAWRPRRASLEVALDAARLKGPLYFRTMEPGDVMRPYGFDGSRKLSDILGEARLTPNARSRLPIVCDLRGPLWAPGICVDGRAVAEIDVPAVNLRFLAHP